MKHARILATAAAATALAILGTITASPATAISGGAPSPQPYSFAGSLQRPESSRPDGHICGVSLVAASWAVTAAHCVREGGEADWSDSSTWNVRFNSLSPSSGGVVRGVADVIRPEGTEPWQFHFGKDVALIQLSSPVFLTPVTIKKTPAAADDSVRIIGWGMTCEGGPECYPDYLQEADTIVRDSTTCAWYPTEFCAGGWGEPLAMNMDSGGPALSQGPNQSWSLQGVVSGSAGGDEPVAYTDTSWFTDWIIPIISE